jgi:hypothetical protein
MLPPTYNEMTDREKVLYWADKMHRWMRAGEGDGDEVEALNRDILLQNRADDPTFDRFMPSILAILARAWADDKEKFLKQVNEQMKEGFEYDRL